MSDNGAYRSENGGTSNRNAGEIAGHRNSKVAVARMVSQGLVGPKVMAKAVIDGYMVNTP